MTVAFLRLTHCMTNSVRQRLVPPQLQQNLFPRHLLLRTMASSLLTEGEDVVGDIAEGTEVDVVVNAEVIEEVSVVAVDGVVASAAVTADAQMVNGEAVEVSM